MLKCQVIGNIGAAPELRYAASGSAVLRFNVASNGRVRTAEGEWRDETTWVRVAVFGQRAERLADLLSKGMRVFASGRLEARPWTGNGGQLNAGLELAADDVEFVSARRREGDDDEIPD